MTIGAELLHAKLRRSLGDCRDILAAAQHIAVAGGSFIGSRPPRRYVTVAYGIRRRSREAAPGFASSHSREATLDTVPIAA